MQPILVVSFLFAVLKAVSSATVHVHNAHELDAALKHAKAGDTIQLADGEYHGKFVAAHVAGPVTLSGSRKAQLSSTSYGLHLDGCSHWTLKGFTIHASKKGLVLDHSSHNTIEDIEVHHIEDEGVHFRKGSSDNLITGSHVHHTGLKQPGFGEGMYVGSAVNNWEGHKPDHADRNKIVKNRIGPNVAAESIDIKEGTCCGLVQGNHFDGTGMKGENSGDSWIDLKGDKWTIQDNTGEHSLTDGIQVHHVGKALEGLRADGHGLLSGCHNKISHTHCSGIHGKCVNVAVHKVAHDGDCPNEVVA